MDVAYLLHLSLPTPGPHVRASSLYLRCFAITRAVPARRHRNPRRAPPRGESFGRFCRGVELRDRPGRPKVRSGGRSEMCSHVNAPGAEFGQQMVHMGAEFCESAGFEASHSRAVLEPCCVAKRLAGSGADVVQTRARSAHVGTKFPGTLEALLGPLLSTPLGRMSRCRPSRGQTPTLLAFGQRGGGRGISLFSAGFSCRTGPRHRTQMNA